MILDENGEEIRAEQIVDKCPHCGSAEVETVRGFGGHVKKICNKCHRIVAEGRERG